MGKGGQASTEYIVLVVLVMILVLPGVYLFFNAANMDRAAKDSQIQHFAQAVISQSERLYSMGPGTRTVVDEQLPEGVTSIRMKSDSETGKYELIIETLDTEYAFACPVPMKTSFPDDAIGSGATVILETVQQATGGVYILASFGNNPA